MLMPYQADILNKFDSVATGMVPIEMAGQGDSETGHVQLAEYVPEVSFLARADRSRLISGWDIPGSLARVTGLCGQAQAAAQNSRWIGAAWPEDPEPLEPLSGDMQARNATWSGQGKFIPVDGGHEEGPTGGVSFIVDSTTLVLLQRMQGISELIGLVTFLVALPLLWMAWMLAANLSGLLMLNERRKLGLMRLRGVPGQRMGQALLLAVSSGGFLGGLLGLVLCSTLLLLVYEGGHLPLAVLLQPQQLLLFAGFLIITLALALLVSWRLVRYATTISPLEASGRIAGSEAAKAAVRFGVLQGASLLLGAYTLAGWIFHFSVSSRVPVLKPVDQVLDFIGFPLFLYGVATLLVSRKGWIQRLLGPVLKSIGGRLGIFALRHIAVKPHRTVSFLLIVGLMATISLYPLITSRSFADKAVRGAQVQMGTEWQVAFNSPSLVDVDKLRGSLGSQMDWLAPQIQRVRDALGQVKGVRSTTYMAEGLLPSFYLPGYGLRGVPIYLIGDVDSYLRNVYSEPELGLGDKFANMIQRLNEGNVAVSPQVADFWNLSRGASVLLGMDDQRKTLFAPDSGTLAFLPGTPPRTVTDRQGFVQARVDYLNYLFSNNAYLVGKTDSPQLANLQVLIPRVIVLARVDDGVSIDSIQPALARALPFPPLQMQNLDQEVQKVGSDMFISLALENLRIYLIGGLILAFIAIMAIALANYTEDRRTLALLRIRGASPSHIWRFLVSMLFSPALLGLVLGAAVALVAGYGLTNYVWELREIRTVVQLLPTRLVVSPLTVGIGGLLLVMMIAVATIFSSWVFRSSARENVQEG
jgi:hypothetical protein